MRMIVCYILKNINDNNFMKALFVLVLSALLQIAENTNWSSFGSQCTLSSSLNFIASLPHAPALAYNMKCVLHC